MADGNLFYYLYRDKNSTNNQIIRAVIEETKNYVFDDGSIVLTSQGYSGVPLRGQTPLSSRRDDLWKIIDVFFRLSYQFDGLVFCISTDDPKQNLFYRECERNEVLPKWCQKTEDFNSKIYGFEGVLHVISPEVKSRHPNVLDIDILRKFSRETRNILVTEAVKQRISLTSCRDFGMQRTSINVPLDVAFIAKQRPDLLSAAIREYLKTERDHSKAEKILSQSSCVMVHAFINSRDWKAVTAVADIESPCDIVSHRISLALIEFDGKYSSVQNGVIDEEQTTFSDVTDAFERERLSSLYMSLTGRPYSMAHNYQVAKSLITNKHREECKKLYAEGMSSSATERESACSGDDEREEKTAVEKKHVYKKRRGDYGKKKQLAAILPHSNGFPRAPLEEDELPTPTSSGQLRNFERAVNGDDVYKESSDEKSLGEDEDMDLFVVKHKPKEVKKMVTPRCLSDTGTVSDDDGTFDVADLIHAAPPLAETDDFDDI